MSLNEGKSFWELEERLILIVVAGRSTFPFSILKKASLGGFTDDKLKTWTNERLENIYM